MRLVEVGFYRDRMRLAGFVRLGDVLGGASDWDLLGLVYEGLTRGIGGECRGDSYMVWYV